jgi:hypothetical protein
MFGIAAGSAALAAGDWAFWPHGAPRGEDPDIEGAVRYGFLTATDRSILVALMPALLGVLWPGEERGAYEARDLLREIDGAILRQKRHTRDELRQLFTLLATPAGAWALLGVAKVAEAPAEQVAEGLERLRDRDLTVFRQAYAGLRDLTLGLWYGQPQHWCNAAYVGPPDLSKGPRL